MRFIGICEPFYSYIREMMLDSIILNIRKLVERLCAIWRNNALFVFCLFLLNLTAGAIYTCMFESPFYIRIKLPIAIVTVFFLSYMAAVIAECIRCTTLRMVWKAVCIGGSSVLFLAESFMLYRFNTIINATTLQIVMESNPNESAEFISNFLSLDMAVRAVAGISIFLFVVTRKVVIKALENALSGKIGRDVLILLLGMGFGGFFYGEYRYHAQGIVSYRIISPLQRLYMSYGIVSNDFKAYQALKENIGIKDPVLTADSSKIDNIVLVIGESLSRDHMGVYGYNLPTTPHLSKLNEEENLTLFTDVVAPSTGTIDVIQRLLTYYNYEKPGNWYDYDILIDIMKKAGYKTFWISNQESFGSSGNLSAAMATRCDYSAFCDIRNSNQESYGDFDEHIFPLLDSLMVMSGDKNLYIIHLMGSHVRYLNRYPKSFEHFSAADEDIPYTQYKKQVRAEYDNSVLYNDSIVSEVILRFMPKETLLIYLSDHAEEVYDDRDYNGRSMEMLTPKMVEVPFMIWTSDSFKENLPYKFEQVKSASTRPYMTDDLIHTILDLADIGTADYDSTRSIVNDAFDTKRERIIGNKNYDILKGEIQ